MARKKTNRVNIIIDRGSLSGCNDSDAENYVAFLELYLDRECPDGDHHVSLSDGDSSPAGYREFINRGWDAFCSDCPI